MTTSSSVSANSSDLRGVIQLGAMLQAARPRENRRDRVGRRGLALLVLAEVASDGAVCGLRLDGLAVRGHQDRRHQPQRAVTLGDRVGLDVAVVVLARPHVAALPLQAGGHHVIDQPVLVGQALLVELLLVLLVEDALELVLEHPVIALEDGVLRRQVDRVTLLQPIVERRAGEVLDRLLEVVHPHDDAAVFGDLHHFVHDRLAAVFGGERHRERAGPVHLEVRRPVLVAERVTADDDRLGPARNQPRHILDHDRRPEDGAAENVSDRPVGREPHLLEIELLDAGLVGGDGGALDADAVLLDGVGGVDGDLVVGVVAVLDAEVVVVQVDVEVREDQRVLDELPDDASHLVTIEVYDRAFDFDLGHVSPLPTHSDRLVGSRV